MKRRLATIAIGMFAFTALSATAGCESTGDRVEQRGERTESQVERRTDQEIDRGVDRALDQIFR